LLDHNVRAVINCTSNVPFSNRPDVVHVRFSVEDNGDERQYQVMTDLLPDAVAAVRDGLRRGNTLVHCQQGKQRSACVVAAYLMTEYGIGLQEAIAHVKQAAEHRPFFPEVNFITSLRAYASR
jgi:protein-tyrosine phosphatase